MSSGTEIDKFCVNERHFCENSQRATLSTAHSANISDFCGFPDRSSTPWPQIYFTFSSSKRRFQFSLFDSILQTVLMGKASKPIFYAFFKPACKAINEIHAVARLIKWKCRWKMVEYQGCLHSLNSREIGRATTSSLLGFSGVRQSFLHNFSSSAERRTKKNWNSHAKCCRQKSETLKSQLMRREWSVQHRFMANVESVPLPSKRRLSFTPSPTAVSSGGMLNWKLFRHLAAISQAQRAQIDTKCLWAGRSELSRN